MSIIEIISLITGGTSLIGVIGAIAYFKPRLRTEKLTAMQKDVEVAKNAMDVVLILEERLESKSKKITELDEQSYASSIKMREQSWLIQEHERKISGVQRELNKETARKEYAERFICFDETCPVRKPALGSYKSNMKCQTNKK